MEEVNESLPFIGFNKASFDPWIYNSWSQGRIKYKFINRKLYIKIEWNGQKKILQDYFEVIMNHLPDEIAEAFLFALDKI